MAQINEGIPAAQAADAPIGYGPTGEEVGSGVQAGDETSLLRLALSNAFGRTTLHLVPIRATMSRGQAMEQVQRRHDCHLPKLARLISGIFLDSTVEIVTLATLIQHKGNPAGLESDQPVEAAIIGPAQECPALTQALRHPALFAHDHDRSFAQLHQDVLTTSSTSSALHVGGEFRKNEVGIAIIGVVTASFVTGFIAGGPVVGFGTATVVSGLLLWWFRGIN
ncbi:hypothetical protein S40293_10730 [Stachybotrys chartarum IBT 40293]|nr:hypothetical protein S40293_10730 [Stachybotrys chartarum IBT 40293]KFA81251.1 hypothetical protein S40288_11453 [Stachybotrys chartarum IBT 40288]